MRSEALGPSNAVCAVASTTDLTTDIALLTRSSYTPFSPRSLPDKGTRRGEDKLAKSRAARCACWTMESVAPYKRHRHRHRRSISIAHSSNKREEDEREISDCPAYCVC